MTKPPGPPYKNPPIEEALVEIRFEPANSDPTLSGKVHEQPDIKTFYNGTPKRALLQTIQAGPGRLPALALQELVHLPNADGTRLLILGPNVLSISVLRPYDGWEKFRPRVEAAWNALVAVAGPKTATRIGIRYINKIVVPVMEIELGKYLRFGLTVPNGIDGHLEGFLDRAEFVHGDGVKVLLNHQSVQDAAGKSGFLIDIDVIAENLAGDTIQAVMAKVDDLHAREGKVFESLITDDSRRLFDE